MTIDTPLHTEPQLDQVAGQFAHWRQPRSHPSERIPQRLWDQAAALAQVAPLNRVATHLRLSPSDLKKQLLAQQESSARAPVSAVSFVEVPAAPASVVTCPGTEIEMQRADGARLRLRSSESALPMAAVVRAFLEAHSCCSSPRTAASWWPPNRWISAKASTGSVRCVGRRLGPTP